MRFMKFLAGAGLAAMLAACGGGGGVSSGNGSGGGSGGGTGGGSGGGTDTAVPTLTLALVDNNGTATTSVSAAGLVYAKATLKDAKGTIVSGTKVMFSVEASLVKLSPAAETLTDASGVATVQMSAATLSAAGAGTITASATVAAASVNAARDFQLAPANLTLTSLDVGSGPLAAYDNRTVSVVANINGVPASSTAVQVAFSASCGTVNPATATTNSAGKASTTYTADSANCAGTNVRIAASSVGVVSPLEAPIAVAAIQATNLQFVSASPSNIYLRGSGAATQSQVMFKVVDSSGNAVQNQAVELSLLNPNVSAGLSIDVLDNMLSVTKTSNATGQVSVAVFSGNVPTSVQVVAKLPGTGIQTNSNTLTVASGKAVQRAASIALNAWSVEGMNVDGTETTVTFSLADRQGNPVPDGTEINFVAESGVMIPPTCVVTGGKSRCVSTFRSSGTRPVSGRVSILAYVPGEEDFVDLDFNNQHDASEPFTDMGNAFRDDNESGDFTPGEFSVPRTGGATCSGGENGRLNTCDGVWGANEVRKQHILVVATSAANIQVLSAALGQVTLRVSDANDNYDVRFDRNSMPTGTTFAAAKISGNDDCTVKSVFPAVLPNVYGPTNVGVDLDKCTSGAVIGFTVTSPLKLVTQLRVTLP